jgi:hypothetical protein
LYYDHRQLAKLDVFNHLAAGPREPADAVTTFDLVDFLLHASPSQRATELSADHELPTVPTAQSAAPRFAGLAPGETAR